MIFFGKPVPTFPDHAPARGTVSAGELIIKAMPTGITPQKSFPHGEERILRVSTMEPAISPSFETPQARLLRMRLRWVDQRRSS
jgi:hypothetical protein